MAELNKTTQQTETPQQKRTVKERVSTIRTLAKSIREYKKPSILAPLFVAGEVICEVFIPLVMTWLLNSINSTTSGTLMSEILKYDGILVALACLSLFFGMMSGKFCAEASSGFAKNLRKDMFYNIQGFSFANIDKFSTSSLVTRMTTDVSNVEMSYMMIIRVAIRAPLMLIFSLVMTFIISWKMALIFLCTMPILAFGLTLIMFKSLPFFKRIFKKYDRMNESVEENIRGMRVVKSYVREDYEKEKFNNASTDIMREFTKAEVMVAKITPLMNFCCYAGIIAIFIVGSFLIVQGNQEYLKLTELQSFMTYSFQMLMSLMMLSMIMVMIVISIASSQRIAEVLNEKSSLVSPENAIKDVSNGDIEFNNVSFKYSQKAEKPALYDINLKIKSGETIGIIGATGSSKTTLINLIPRLYDVSGGELKVAGHNVKEYDLESLRNAVSVVLQKNVLFSGTIKDNMRWGNKNATDEEIVNACKLAQADEFIMRFVHQYDTYIEQGGVNVSGGQKQRLCIARALLKNPKILILDDSTSAVDTKTDALIRKGLKEYIPSTTKIIIAQRIASVQDADKILIMENGTITAIGNHKELLKNNEIYQELYYSQNKEAKKEVE